MENMHHLAPHARYRTKMCVDDITIHVKGNVEEVEDQINDIWHAEDGMVTLLLRLSLHEKRRN